jgi:catechol 2,3-dioxygenase-like lactoylglutathione lyase family enzyme
MSSGAKAWHSYAAGSEVAHFADFCKTHLIQSEDRWEGRPLVLERWQRRMLGEALAYDEDGWSAPAPAFRNVPRRSRSKIEGVSLAVTLPLIDHLALRVRDLKRSRTFYEQALEPFGVKVVESSQGPGFAIEGGGDFWIGEGEPPAAPVHVAFAAADRATVDKFHRAAVEAGGRDNGAPGLRPHYHAEYYAAFVIDPDGNNVEAVFHGDRHLPAA